MPSARPAPASPRRQPRSPAPASRPRRVSSRGPGLRFRWDRAGRVSLLVVLVVVIGLYAQHTLSYLATRAQASQQQMIVNRLAAQNAALAREQRALSQPATIVSHARALGMVRPNERPYVITGHSGH